MVQAADFTGAEQSLKFRRTNPRVLLALFIVSVVNMFSPGKIFTDGNSKILATVHHFQDMAMYLVAGID